MKQLLTTSVLASFISGSAYAATLNVKVGGMLDFQAGTRSQTNRYGNDVAGGFGSLVSLNNKRLRFDNTAHLFVKAEGRADNGLVYGAVVRITPTVTLDKLEHSKKYNRKTERTYMYLESKVGRFEMGSNYSAGETMKIGAESLAAATGGISGDWQKYVNLNLKSVQTDLTTTTNATYGGQAATPKYETFILEPNLLSDYEVKLTSDNEKARKITYFTARNYGFQFGISYTPDSSNRGHNGRFALGTGATDTILRGTFLGFQKDRKNELNGGIQYMKQFHNHMVLSAALTGDYANGKSDMTTMGSRKALRSYNAGAKLDYAGFSVAGSYGSWGRSLSDKTVAALQLDKSSTYWTAGVAYSQGPARVSLTYLNSKIDRNKFRNYALGADYLLAPGMLPYAEVVSFKQKPFLGAGEGTPKNRGTVYMIGTELRF